MLVDPRRLEEWREPWAKEVRLPSVEVAAPVAVAGPSPARRERFLNVHATQDWTPINRT